MNAATSFCVLLGFLFLPLLPLSAQSYSDILDEVLDETAPEDTESVASKQPGGLEMRLSGVSGLYFGVPIQDEEFRLDAVIERPALSQDLSFKLAYDFFSLKVGLRAKLDLEVSNGGTATIFSFDPLENFVAFDLAPVYLSVGYQNFFWGSAYELNPVDKINSFDNRYGSRRRKKLPLLAANIEVAPTDFLKLQAVYAPFLPEDRSAEETREELLADPKFGEVTVANTSLDFSHPTAGGRVSVFTRFMDVSLSYLYAPDTFSSAVLNLSTPMPLQPVDLTLERRSVHHLGFDLTAIVKEWTLWLEMSVSIPEDRENYEVRNPQVEYVVGFDRFFGKNNDMFVNVQYYGRYYAGLHDDPPGTLGSVAYVENSYYQSLQPSLANVEESYLHGLFLHMEFPFTVSRNMVDLRPALSFAYYLPAVEPLDNESEEYGSIWIHPRVEISPLDSLEIGLGAEVYFAMYEEDGSFQVGDNGRNFGRFFDNTLVYFDITYSWGVSR